MTSSEVRALIVRADSLLSLLWHRHVPRERKDLELSLDVERTIQDLRDMAKLLSSVPAEAERQREQKTKTEDQGLLGTTVPGDSTHPPLSTVEQQGAGYISSRERTFEGWAIVDVLGHQRHVGYVTTEYFGQTAFFRVVTPARDARERLTKAGEYISYNKCPYPPEGARVQEDGKPMSERLIGAGSVYSLTPSTREKVMELADENDPRPVLAVLDAEGKPIEKDDDLPW